MPISSGKTKVVGIGDGTGLQEFTFDFDYHDESAIKCWEIDPDDLSVAPVAKTLTTDYTVTASPQKIVCTGSWTPASGAEVHIERHSTRLQAIDFPTSGAFSSASADEAHDRAALMAQEVEVRSARPGFPVKGATSATVSLSSSAQTILATSAIDADPGMTGSVVMLIAQVYLINNASVDADELVSTYVYAGTNGSTADTENPLGRQSFPVLQSHGAFSHALLVPNLRVPDGHKLSFALKRSGSGGTLSSWDQACSIQTLITGSY